MLLSHWTRRKFIRGVGLASLTPVVNSVAMDVKLALDGVKRLLDGRDPIRWLFAGDSITQGAKHTFGYRAFPEIFAERVRWEMKRGRDIVINSAISGSTVGDILADFEWRIAQFRPNVVLLMVGTNDAAYPSIVPRDFKHTLRILLTQTVDKGAIPILITPNPISKAAAPERQRLDEFVVALRQTAEMMNLLCVDVWNDWSKSVGYPDLLEDAIHPNARGHVAIAHQLFEKLGIFDSEAPTCKNTEGI